MMNKTVPLGVLLLVCLLASCTSVPQGITPVSPFDIGQYTGTWYEIARFDHSFERGLQQVTAEYSIRQDGGVTVVNRGFNTAEKEWEQATGKAYFVDDKRTGHLKVSFFGPFYSSYVVFALDQQNYSYSLVTGPDREYLWILARSPVLSDTDYTRLVNIAKEQGFDVSKLIKVQH